MIEAPIEEYASAAIQHGESTLNGDYNAGNRAFDRIIKIYRSLKSEGPAGQRNLQALFTHPHKSVRIWAVTHTLEVSPEESEKVLEEETAGDGILEFNARMTLDQWRKGTLEFP